MPYVCDNHDDRPAVLLVTNLANGDTQAVCADDILPLTLAIADSMAPEGSSVQVISDAMVAQLAAAEHSATPAEPEAGESTSDGDGGDPGLREFGDDTVAAALADTDEQNDAAAQDDAGAPEPESVSL